MAKRKKVKAPTSAGKRVNDLIINDRLSLGDATRRVLGSVETSLPPGATLVSTDGINHMTYVDAQGVTHNVIRDGDATSPDFGRITSDVTDKPPVRSGLEQIPGLADTLTQAQSAVGRGLSGQLGSLSDTDKALLDQITQSSLQQIRQRFEQEQGQLVANLFARGMNESTLAGDVGGRLLQQQGLVENQVLSDAAGREIGVRQFLQQLATGAGTDILGQIIGNETQRALGSAQATQAGNELGQRRIESSRNFLTELQKIELQKQNQSAWRSVLASVATLGSAAVGGFGIPGAFAGVGGGGGVGLGQAMQKITPALGAI